MISRRYLNDHKETIKLSKIQRDARDCVIKKLDGRIYKQILLKCECGADENEMEILAEKDRYGIPVTTRICKNCGLIMTNPSMDQNSLNSFYDQDYRPLYTGNEDASYDVFKEQFQRGMIQAEFVSSIINLEDVKRILEIGCGAGGILKAFSEIFVDAEIEGIDLGERYISYGRLQGLELRKASSEVLISENKKYDLIICSHSLEHFLDLKRELNNISELLSENGVLFIEVPGIFYVKKVYGDFMRYLQNAHIRSFTLGTLEQIMNKNGFELINGNEIIQSLFKYTGKKKTISMNYYNSIMDYITDLEKKHIWEFFKKRYLRKNRIIMGIYRRIKS